jgi:hypothetical protein
MSDMNLDRLEQIVDSYGANPQHWPEAERSAAISLCESSGEAKALVDEAAALDNLLNQFQVDTVDPAIMQGILAATSQTVLDQIVDWLLPDPDQFLLSLWRPALVASIPFVFGISIGIATVEDFSGIDEFNEDDEFYLLAITDDSSQWWNYE